VVQVKGDASYKSVRLQIKRRLNQIWAAISVGFLYVFARSEHKSAGALLFVSAAAFVLFLLKCINMATRGIINDRHLFCIIHGTHEWSALLFESLFSDLETP